MKFTKNHPVLLMVFIFAFTAAFFSGCAGAVENNKLLEKHDLKIEVHAWNNYMPSDFDPGMDHRSNFVVAVTSLTNTDLPDITVSAKISSAKKTINVRLIADSTEDNFHKLYRVKNANKIGMADGETFTAVITIYIGKEKQTMTFDPVVGRAV